MAPIMQILKRFMQLLELKFRPQKLCENWGDWMQIKIDADICALEFRYVLTFHLK